MQPIRTALLALLLAGSARADLLAKYSPDLADFGQEGCDVVQFFFPCLLDTAELSPDETARLLDAGALSQSQPTGEPTAFRPGWPVDVPGPFDIDRYLTFELTPDAGVGLLLDRLTYLTNSAFNGAEMGSELSMALRTSLDGFSTDIDTAIAPSETSGRYELEFDLSGLPRPILAPIELRLYPINDGEAEDAMDLLAGIDEDGGLRLFGSTTLTGPTFTVTRLDDPAPDACAAEDCSLREAAIASAESAEPSFIVLPEGRIELSIPAGEEASGQLLPELGDIDLAGDSLVTVLGAGQSESIVDANGIGRAFQTRSARFFDLTVTGGVSEGPGGGILSEGDGQQLGLFNVSVIGNRSDGFGGGLLFGSNAIGQRVVVETPPSIMGGYIAGPAVYGRSLDSGAVEGMLAAAIDTEGVPEDACSSLSAESAADVAGGIALVNRGTCSFSTKTYNAQLAGAIGVIIVDNVASAVPPVLGADANFEFLDDIDIPTVSVTLESGELLRSNLGSAPTVRLEQDAERAANAGLTVEHSRFEANSAPNASAMLCAGDTTCTIRDSSFTGNEAGFQGAVQIREAEFSIDGTTIAESISGSWPGGLLATRAVGRIVNSTFSGNEAGGDGLGGAMGFFESNVDLRHLTITGNRSTMIPGIASFNGSNVSIGGSIVDDDCGVAPGGLVSAGGNILTRTNCEDLRLAADLRTDRYGVARPAVGLETLQDNGGPTMTHAIDGGSAAIGHVPIGLCETTDQRGEARVPYRCDAGAYQAMPNCGVGVVIPDDGTTVTSLVSTSGDEISQVEVSLDIAHPTISDLNIELVHLQSGITRTLVNQPLSADPPFGDCQGNNLRTVISDAGENLIDESCDDGDVAFPDTRYRAQQPLSVFAGETANANWQLRVTDIVGGTAGILVQWCLLMREGGIFGDGFE